MTSLRPRWTYACPGHSTAARRLLYQARGTVTGFPQLAGLDAVRAGEVTTDAERAPVVAMLSLFQRFIIDITLDFARLSQPVGGADVAHRNPFPLDQVEWAPPDPSTGGKLESPLLVASWHGDVYDHHW